MDLQDEKFDVDTQLLGGLFTNTLDRENDFIQQIKAQFLADPNKLVKCDKPDSYFCSDVFEDYQRKNRLGINGLRFIKHANTFKFWHRRNSDKFSNDIFIMALYSECYDIAEEVYNKIKRLDPDYKPVGFCYNSEIKDAELLEKKMVAYNMDMDHYADVHCVLFLEFINSPDAKPNPYCTKFLEFRSIEVCKWMKFHDNYCQVDEFVIGHEDDYKFVEQLKTLQDIKFDIYYNEQSIQYGPPNIITYTPKTVDNTETFKLIKSLNMWKAVMNLVGNKKRFIEAYEQFIFKESNITEAQSEIISYLYQMGRLNHNNKKRKQCEADNDHCF